MFLFHGVRPKKITVPALILTLLFAALAGSLLINQAAANPVGLYYPRSPPPAPLVDVIEVETDTLTLTFSVQETRQWVTPYGSGADYEPAHVFEYAVSVLTWVDGKPWIPCGFDAKPVAVSLEGLCNGEHTLEVIATASGEGLGWPSSQGSSGIVEFQIDNPLPSIRVLTGQETFEASGSAADVPVNFIVSEPVSWIGCSLDGGSVLDVTDQVALTMWSGRDSYGLVLSGLSDGAHNLVVYAEDSAGNRGASEPFSFTVTAGEPSGTVQGSTLFPTTTAVNIAVIASAAAVSFGLVAYLLRRKSKRRNQT
jgi:hypothetical protein